MSELSLFQNGSQLPAHIRRGELNAITKVIQEQSQQFIQMEQSGFNVEANLRD